MNNNHKFYNWCCLATPAAWGYTQKNGPSSWSKLSESYALCVEGKKQSPIAIETASAVHSDKTYIKLEKLNSLMTGTLSNTGHSLEYKPNTDSPVPFVEASADFPGLEFCNPFRLAQFHFHWGSNDQEGSEHLVDGNRGCGEIHFVYANSKYENAKIAVKQPDGLIVVGYMLRVEEESALDYLFKFIPEISVSKDQVKNIPFQISQFFQEKSAHGSGGFYVYQGSLTTPPCHESVTWFLSPLQLGITREQLAVLRSQRVDEHTPLEHNFRPIQPLNGRKIIQIQCKSK